MKIRTRVAASLVTLITVSMLAGCSKTRPLVKSETPVPQAVPAEATKNDANKVRGTVNTVVGKSNTISIKISDKEMMVFKFDKETVFKNASGYKDLSAGEKVDVVFKAVGAENIATVLSKVLAELPKGTSEIKVDELKALLSKSPEDDNYLLFDTRPAGRFHQATILNSLSLPITEMEKMDKEGKVSPYMPNDKNKMLIFWCGGIT
ncbi:MAG: rhodanese-like domain-containing protein [Geobacteraceae bacterium]|nr:rhodanese-like domain-containing protein [Geobacteraceae bacterium]NTW80521.1 rhodanese-like domain-containing protein [Geobacteraceae bacterium]